jgi:uncharacterized membrane protein
MRLCRRVVCFAFAAIVFCLPAIAATVPWTRLTPAQHEALAPLSSEWDALPEKRQQHLLKLAKRYPQLTPQQKKNMHDRLWHWSKMTPQEHKLARERYDALRKLPPQQRSQLKQMLQKDEAEQAAGIASAPAAAQ